MFGASTRLDRGQNRSIRRTLLPLEREGATGFPQLALAISNLASRDSGLKAPRLASGTE
jgi:hypothetical protein